MARREKSQIAIHPLRVVGYVRTSTDRQDLSPDAQRAALQTEADRRAWSLTFIEDTCSGGKQFHKRDGGKRALDLLRRGQVDALVVMRLDRLSRSVVDFGTLLKVAFDQRWAIITLDFDLDMTSPNGKLVANIVMAVAEWERDMISKRTCEGLAVKKAQGAKLGGRRHATSDEAAARVILLRNQGLTLQATADLLNVEDVPTALGGRWHASTVRGVLARLASA